MQRERQAHQSPESSGTLVLRSLGGLLVGKLRAFFAVPALVIGAIALTGVWQIHEDGGAQWELAARLTETAEGHIERAWWRVTFDPDALLGGGNWTAAARGDLCLRVAYADGEASPGTAAFCREFYLFPSLWSLVGLTGLGDGAPLPLTDPDGRPELGLQFPRQVLDWLRANRSVDSYGFTAMEEPSAFEVLWRALDRPAEIALRSWSTPRRIALRHDPERPEDAVAASMLDESQRSDDLVMIAFFSAFGLIVWSMGCVVLFYGSRRWLPVLVIVATVAALPLWERWVWHGLNLVWDGAGDVVGLVRGELMGAPPAIRLESPGYQGEAGDEDYSWSPETSAFAPALSGIDLTVPSAPLAPNEALRALVKRVATEVAALPDARTEALFRALAGFENRGLTEAGLLFVEAGRATHLDKARPTGVRDAALAFLRERADFIGFVSAVRPAGETRVELLYRLRGIDDPLLQGALDRLLARSREEWVEQGRPFPPEPPVAAVPEGR